MCSCALKGATVHEVKDGGAEVGELLGAGMAHKLSRVNNLFCSSMASLLEKTRIRITLSLPLINLRTPRAKKAPYRKRTDYAEGRKRRAACYWAIP